MRAELREFQDALISREVVARWGERLSHLPALKGMPENVRPVFERLYKDPHYLQLKKKEKTALRALSKAEEAGDTEAMIAADRKFMEATREVQRYEKGAGVPGR
jgi:hypothetical protein